MLTIFESIRKEFSVNDNGISFTTKRGLARLCGITANYWGKKYFFNQEIDSYVLEELNIYSLVENKNMTTSECFVQQGLVVVEKGGFLIQDVLASIVIEFYATEKKVEQAKITNRALRAIGLRTVIQEATGWNKPKRDYGNLLLSAPRVWTKVFGDEYYDQLSRLTGLDWDKKTHQKPCIFAQLTNDLVYSHLPSEVYNKIKQTQKEHGGYIHKMHQFLNEDGLTALITHLDKTLYILSAVASIESAKHLVTQSVTGIYQQTLFGE